MQSLLAFLQRHPRVIFHILDAGSLRKVPLFGEICHPAESLLVLLYLHKKIPTPSFRGVGIFVFKVCTNFTGVI